MDGSKWVSSAVRCNVVLRMDEWFSNSAGGWAQIDWMEEDVLLEQIPRRRRRGRRKGSKRVHGRNLQCTSRTLDVESWTDDSGTRSAHMQ